VGLDVDGGVRIDEDRNDGVCAVGRVPWPVLGLVADVVEDADMALGQGPARRRRKQGASAAWWVLDVRAGRRRTGVRVAEGVRPGN